MKKWSNMTSAFKAMCIDTLQLEWNPFGWTNFGHIEDIVVDAANRGGAMI
jgi:hypothetical protein